MRTERAVRFDPRIVNNDVWGTSVNYGDFHSLGAGTSERKGPGKGAAKGYGRPGLRTSRICWLANVARSSLHVKPPPLGRLADRSSTGQVWPRLCRQISRLLWLRLQARSCGPARRRVLWPACFSHRAGRLRHCARPTTGFPNWSIFCPLLLQSTTGVCVWRRCRMCWVVNTLQPVSTSAFYCSIGYVGSLHNRDIEIPLTAIVSLCLTTLLRSRYM